MRKCRSIRYPTALLKVVISIMLAAAASLPLLAQTFYGSILGTVTDASGAVIPGASVTLTNRGTAERRAAETDSSGNYRFVNLVPGAYRLDVELTGFKHYTREPIAVEVQAAVRIDLLMEVGNATETMVVTASTPLLQTESTTLGQVAEQRTVQEMPLNGRNVLNLVALVPGVVPQAQSMANPTTVNNTAWGNYQIGGGLANQSAAYLDGGPLNVNYVNMISLVPTQDAILEFRVQTNTLSPEFGRFSGGVVSLTSKSGANDFHGAAYEFMRNKVLNSNSFFNNRNGVERAPYTQNQFGANLGGRIIKDKTFFFASYEGYRQRQGSSFQGSVPTEEFRNGNFSNLRNSSGGVVQIYDPLTTTATTNSSGSTVYSRTPFEGNVIPASRLDKTAQALTKAIFPAANRSGEPYTGLYNYTTNVSSGGNNDQVNFRIDQNVSDKQRIFGRYTNWSISAIPYNPYGTQTGMDTKNRTQQFVLADTYLFSPTIVGDLRVSFLRYNFDQNMLSLGTDLTQFGWSSSLNSQIPHRVWPVPVIQNYSEVFDGSQVAFILSRNNSYSIAPSVTMNVGRHLLKAGFEVRRLDFNFSQSLNTSGQFNFDNAFTAANPLSPTGSGYSWASFMLGYGSSGNAVECALTSGRMMYHGYYLNDTYQVTSKLTLSLGVRWDLPFGWTEKWDRLTVLLPNTENSLASATGLSLKGKLALVNSTDRADRHGSDNHWRLFAPRVGAAYRVSNKSVIRAGYGISYIPPDAVFNTSPFGSPVNSATTTWVSTLDGGLTPNATLSNPFPNGINQPLARSASYDASLLGQTISGQIPNDRFGYVQQWNFNVERQLAEGAMIEVAYAGARGAHIQRFRQQLNQLPEEYLSLGSQLLQQVANPFYGYITSGSLASKTVTYGQLLRPYPQYTGVSALGAATGNTSYNSLQVKFEKRFRHLGVILGSYTWAKFMTDVETATFWNDRGAGNVVADPQNWNDLSAEWSLSSNDIPHRLVVSYVVDLPFGKGQKFLGNVRGLTGKLVSGWNVSGVSTFQSGAPIGLTTAVNSTNSYGGGSRPNVVAGCNAAKTGSAQSRLRQWFDTSCFTAPAAFTFGNVSRTIGSVRAAGVNNWDFTLQKGTRINERFDLRFRAEFFNLFNRVLFGQPGQSLGLGTFGIIRSQANNPRLVQLALRLQF